MNMYHRNSELASSALEAEIRRLLNSAASAKTMGAQAGTTRRAVAADLRRLARTANAFSLQEELLSAMTHHLDPSCRAHRTLFEDFAEWLNLPPSAYRQARRRVYPSVPSGHRLAQVQPAA